MNEFYFDLQRFEDDNTVTTTQSKTFDNAGTYTFTINGTSYSITLSGSSPSATVSTDENNSVILTVASGTVSNLIYSDTSKNTKADDTPVVNLLNGAGIFQTYQRQQVTLGTQKISFAFNSEGESATLTPGPNTLKVTQELETSATTVSITAPNTNSSSTVASRIEFTFGDFYYINEKPSSNLNLDLNIDTDSNYSFSVSPPSTEDEVKRIRYDSSLRKFLALTNGTIILGKDSTGLYVSDLENGDAFSTYTSSDGTKTNEVTYKMGTTISATRTNSETGKEDLKFYGGEDLSKIYLDKLDFDTSMDLHPALAIAYDETTGYGTLPISSDVVSKFTSTDSSLTVVSKDNGYTYSYGTLEKASDTSFKVVQGTGYTKYAAINIDSGYTVEFSSTITDATITIADTTVFSVTNTAENYSLTSGTSPLSVGGATGLSLTSGTLLTSTAAQTIAAGDYSVYGYNDSVNTNDGITIGLSNGNVIVGDIDIGESLSAYDTTAKATSNYTMLVTGLLKQTGDTYSIYRNNSTGGTFDGSLTLGSAGDLLIAPDSGTLEIGTTNSLSGVVFDSESNPVSLYAELTKDTSGNYTLNTISGAVSDLTGWASTISLTGSNTYTIHESLAGENVTIATKDSKTTFKVTATGSSKTFTVSSGTAEAPTITGATAITLLSGSITATKDQTITLGDSNNTFAVTSSTNGIKISFDTNTNTATINAYKGDSFTVGGENYTVADGDGITFVVDKTTGKVTKISDLETVGDTFTRDSTGYSVKGAGFVTGDSPWSIWSADNSHSLSGGSVETASLTVVSNWLGVMTIDGSVTVPAGTNAGLLTDSDFDYTYGELTYGSNSASLIQGSNDKGKLSSININSGSTQYSLTASGSNFYNVSIAAPNSTIMVGNSTNGSYQVTLDGAGGNTGLIGATSASLISGKLTATSILAGGVVVDNATVIPGETVTLTTGEDGASISGLSSGEKFTVNNDAYVFTGAGLRNATQIKRGTKANSSVTSNTLALASITSTDDWLGMRGVSSISGVEIGDNRNIYDVFLVDDYTNDTQPSKLYGELITVSGGGYSLSTVTNSDAWEDNYTITVDTTTVTISSGFEGASIKASQTGAAFKVDSLNDGATEFVVTDTTAGTGATLSGAKAITQTDGLIAVADSKIQSVTVGEYTIANSDNLSLDVSASGGTEATLSSLDEGENFKINSTGYSIISGLGLRTDDQFFKDSSITSFSSATLSELTTLTNTNEWIYIAAIKDDILTVPPTIDSSANEWLVLDDTKTTRYAQLTKDATSGVYSITKDTNDWDDKFTISVGTNETLNLTADFKDKKISGKSSGALFTVSDDASYSVIDATGGASIGNATNISLSAGTISLNSANQTISGGDSVISGNGTDIKLTVTDNKATVSALATGDSFKVAGVTYTLLSNGRLQRGSDNSIWNGSTIKTDDSGSIAVASLGSNNWNGAISTDSNGNVTIDSAATAVLDTISSATAFIVKGDAPTSIYGSFAKDSDTYKLSTSGINTGATLPSVTITEDVGKLNFTKDLVNVSITAGSTTFTATKAASGYTVNYSSSELSVDDATAINLTTGTLAIKNSTQLVTANNQSVQAVSEAVNITYDSNGVTVDGITTAGESVKINDNTYTLASDTTGDGISVNINNGTTTIKDITVGDKFVIDNETFLYTSAGLTKTEANSDKISYVLKAVHPTSGELTLDELQSIDEDTWLGIYLADSGNVTLSSDITHSVVLVDSVTDPTTNYGQVKLSNGTYTLQKYSGDDEALKAIADQIQNPTSITVEKGITAVIDSVFSSSTTSIPVKANNATSITVTDSSGKSYEVGGTVDKFIPSTMTFTPAENDEFTINGTTYLNTVAGLTKGNKIWTKANVTDYVLPDDDAWSGIVKLTTDNILDITKISPEEGSNIVVDNSSSTRWATLDYTAATDTTPATYSLKYIESDKLAAVQLADGTATFTVNYVTTITTGNGTYTINDNDYTGSGLVVATTASTSTLQDGTVTLDSTTQAVTATNDSAISVTSGEITATASNGKWDTLNNLAEGDTFKIGDNTYKVYGSNTLAKLNSSGEPEKIYNSYITNGKLDYSKIVGDDYSAVVQLNSDDQLDLTKKLSVTSAIVVGQENGTIDPTVRVAQIDYSETDDAYTLSEITGGVISTLKGVLLGTAVKSFNTALETTVITSGTDTFTVNGNNFAALNALTITTASNNSAFLTNGKVTVAEGATVTTRYTDTSNHDTTITSTTGTLTVIADSTENTVTISDMDAGDVFSVGTNSYTMTSVGLTNGTKLNYNALKNNGITTAEFDLTDDDWKNILSTDSGVLTITNAVGSNVFVADVDTTNPSSAVKYGTITKSSDDGIYTLTQADGNDTALEGIILTSVKVTFPTTCTNTNITAKGATFKVTASEPFTIDAASTTLSMSDEVTAVELTSGTLQATNGIPITASGNVITTTSGTMTVGIDDTGVFVGGLNEDETFTVGNTSYKKTAAGLLDVTNQKLRSAVTDTYYIGSSFDRIIEAPNGALDLSNEKQSAEVYDSISAPTTHMASLTVDDNGLTLKSVDGGISTVTLAKDAKLTVTFAATVNGSGTTTVNSVPYEGTNLVIDATATSSSLQSGTVTIDSGGSVKATKDSTALAVTSGSITATAADGRFTNIASLVSGDIFTFNSKTYTQTAIGLISSDNKLNGDISTDVTIANLSGTAWQDIHQATSGALTINTSTGSDVVVVDIPDDKAQSKRYGTLTKSGATYTLAQEDTDSQLASITLDGVKASLPTTCANINMTAKGATFKVTASEPFTIDAASTTLGMSDEVTAVELTSGTLQATNGIPITANGSVITTTSGTMTVGIDDTGVFVGNLNEDETFTVDGTSYKMTAAGLMNVTNQKLRAAVTDTYYIGTSFDRIISADGSSLDLSNETQSAEVYDSITAPTTHMATLKVSGGKLTLSEVNGGIDTITLADGAKLTVTFAATVTGNGNITVNSVSYNGTDLVIDATATSSTLQKGTVTIDSGESVQATKDSTPLEVTSGSIDATATNGKFTTLTNVDVGDQFSFNDNSYIQSSIGLIKDSTISAELATSTINISDLDSAKWLDFIAPSGGVLNLTNVTVNALVLDSATAPTTKLADLTISNSRFNLKGADNPTDIEAVTLPENSNLNVDFATQVYSPAGSVTVNSTTFDAASEVIIDFDGSTATLYEGTVNLDTTKPTVKATNDSSALKVLRGSLTATVFDGLLVSLGELDTKDSFSFNDTTYTKTALGLMKDDLISENLAGSTIEIADIDTATWSNIIVPLNQTIDLTSATNALVCDDATNPTVKFATFTNSDGVLTLVDDGDADEQIKSVDIADGTTLTVDFVTQVNAPIGSVIVNSKSYNGTSKLVIQSDGSTSTLTSGTVTLNTGDSVSTTNGNTISVSDGDGLTVTVGNNVTINGMNIGDAFKVDDNSYKVTESGLINTSGKFWTGSDFSDGLTVDALNLATNWTGIVVAKDGVLSVGSSTLANDETSTVVDDLSNPAITYGKLTKADDVYTLTKDADNTLSGIKVDNVKIDIDNNLAGVPLTITTPDGIKTSLNVTASAKFSNFTVDATGNNPTVDNVNAIEISAGKIELLDGQTISLAEDAQEVAIFAGNGTFNVGDETFTIAELGDNTFVEFDFDTDGNANSVIGFNKDSTVTIDGTTYTAPENNAILHYTEEDNWYFDGFAYDDYTVTVDTNGNVLVMPGVKFSDVISSGKTLSDDGTIKFAADYTKTPVTIVNQGKVALNINDADDNTLAENLSKHKNVTFNADGVETEDLTAVAGATFKLQDTKSLTAGDTKVTANDNDCEIGVGEDGTSISADKDATINAPADIALTLNAGDYNINGADFTGSGTTTATTTADGVKLDLANSDSIIYDSMTLSSAGTAKIDDTDGVTLSGGAKVANATNRALTVDGTAYLDDKTINTAKATEVTTTSAGIKVGNRNVTVTGDNDGYTVNIVKRDVVGLENIGNSEGVTVDGLKNATIKTDKAGSFTAGGKTFIYNNDSVTYGLDNGSIVSISDAEQIIGDFSDRVSVNGDGIRLTGSTDVTLSANKNGVTKLELSDEGTYRVNNKTYEIEDEGGFAFDMSGGSVTGVESVENGSLIISQNESGFGVNDGIVTLTSNSNPVTLGIVDSNIVSVSGVDGTINGLENATVYGLSNAVINNKPFKVSGSDEYNAIVEDGVVNSIGGITDGAIISSAPNVTVTTAENGTFTFDSTEYKVNDTLDASVDFTTDENSHVIEINNFAGAVSGVLEGVQSLNGKDFSISGAGEVSVTSDGDNITGIIGITDGTEINGDVADLHYVLPEGKVTVNGIAYELEGDDNGALFVSNDGRALTGLDKDATLSVGAAGNYTINGTPFTVDAGDAFTVNRDGAYVIDPKSPPISEKTESADILARGENPVYVRPTATGNQTVDLTGDSNLALIDSANANVSVQAGAGNDSVVVRHDAAVDVNLDENGSTLIIPTAGKVTLENYNGDNAKVQTFDYSDVSGAIKSNEIKFGDGVMTLGDAIVTYDTEATDTGSTTGKLINAHGKELAVGFTHQNGGLLDESTSNENYLMKGNYAENSSDTQKGGGSTILTGSGNDTILAGAGDYIDAGGGYNQIYLTDKNMRNSVPEGATIVMNEGAYDTVSNFAGGFSGDDDKILIKNLSELGFGYGAGDLVMSAGSGQITFDNLSGNDHYELKLTDGTNEYKAAVAKAESVMAVNDSNEAEIFYGNEQGISFSEYTGAVEVNLNENAGSLNGSAVQYYGLNKVTGGAGDTSLIGAANTPNTLTAGTGNGSIWSNSGRDLMVGNTDAGKSGTTTFFYMPGDGRDTITNFDFMSGTTDINADKIQLDDTSGVTDVFLNGNDVMIGINNGADDYLRLVDAKGKSFRFNDDLIAKVDTNVEFDGFTNCYVGIGNTPTLTIGEGMGDVGIWLSDDSLEYHGIWYDGNFAVLDASAATGRNILAGNEMNNLIIGGASENSIWGGYASSNDTLVGGSGQNTFFFALENGHDVIQNAHDGDLISLEDIYLDNIARADITSGGAVIELTDGSRLEVQSSAAIDYRLQDGTTYTADRTTGEWVQK